MHLNTTALAHASFDFSARRGGQDLQALPSVLLEKAKVSKKETKKRGEKEHSNKSGKINPWSVDRVTHTGGAQVLGTTNVEFFGPEIFQNKQKGAKKHPKRSQKEVHLPLEASDVTRSLQTTRESQQTATKKRRERRNAWLKRRAVSFFTKHAKRSSSPSHGERRVERSRVL